MARYCKHIGRLYQSCPSCGRLFAIDPHPVASALLSNALPLILILI